MESRIERQLIDRNAVRRTITCPRDDTSAVIGATIDLRFDSPAAEQRFLEKVLAPNWDRYRSSAHWQQGWFWRYGQFEPYDVGLDGGQVRLVFDGDPAGFVDTHGDAWEAADGLADWSLRRYDEAGYESLLAQQREAKGWSGGTLEYRYKPLTSRLALTLAEEFDDELPAAPDPTDQNPLGIGFWSLLHSLFVQSGYDWYDEIAALERGLESRLHSIASYRGADAAREEYARLQASIRDLEAELETWLEEQSTGEATI